MAEASLAAVEAAMGPPGRVASLIIPADCQWEPGSEPIAKLLSAASHEIPNGLIEETARLLRQDGGCILLGGTSLTVRGLRAAARIAAATGCGVWAETLPSSQECGIHVPHFASLPYFPEKACEVLANVTTLVLAGAREPVAFFAYPDLPSRLAPKGATIHMLADPDAGGDATLALEMLAQELDAPAYTASPHERQPFAPNGQALVPDRLCQTIAAYMPENSIFVNEGLTTGLPWTTVHASSAPPHTMLGNTGGSIGQGLPTALGAALACPDRRVIAFQADGSGLYTLQALWSVAREGANVTVIICANRCYRILQVELARAGVEVPGPRAQSLTELKQPVIDWTALAKGFGMPACSVRTDSELVEALKRAFTEPGPSLVEAVLC